MNKFRMLLVLALVAAVYFYFTLDAGQYLQLQYLQSQLDTWREFRRQHFFISAAIFMATYILFTGLSVPGSTLLTLLGGAPFSGGAGDYCWCHFPAQ